MMNDSRGLVEKIRKLHEKRMELIHREYAVKSGVRETILSHDEIDTVNEIDEYLDTISRLLVDLNDERMEPHYSHLNRYPSLREFLFTDDQA